MSKINSAIMLTANLCKCNNCDSILIDQNSQIGAKEYQLTGKEIEMQYIENQSIWFVLYVILMIF
jgi:hypothetical protein